MCNLNITLYMQLHTQTATSQMTKDQTGHKSSKKPMLEVEESGVVLCN